MVENIEVEVGEYDDRGVAPAMQYIIQELEYTIWLFMVCYDHIEDTGYELMVAREDEVLAELGRRLGDGVGLGESSASCGLQCKVWEQMKLTPS